MSRPVKGLMIKDLRLIFSQMKLFLIVIAVWAVFMTVSLKEAFFVGYIALMFSFITLSTFNYDETDKGMCYLFTLPIKRKDYIKEKYLLGVMITIVPALTAVLFTCIPMIFINAKQELLDCIFSSIITIPAAIVLLALEIPLYIKFGQDKRRVVTMISIGIMAACFGIFGSFYEMAGGNNVEITHSILGINIWLLAFLIILAAFGFTVLSYKISCFFMEKKQF